MRKVKRKSRLNKLRIFSVLFAIMFIVSLFTGIKAFAETGPFKLNSATISDKASGVTGSISSFNDSEVINDITFYKLDDYATFKFELKSNLNREITILEITDDNSNSYIAYEYDKHENEKLASNGTLNFIVKAVYKTELTDTSKRNQTNIVKFTIKYLDNGEEKSDEIIVNPQTGDGISKSIIMLIISSVGLVTCITLDKKRKSKKLSKLSVLILTGLVLSPIVVKAATFAYELTLKSTIGLYDKVVVTIDDKVNPVTTQTIEYNTKLDSLPSPTKTGYTLTNWTVNNEEFDITKEITEDITIEANYRKNNYTITFNANVPVGGTLDPATSMADMDMKYDEEKNLLPNGYLVTGYLFDSWNTMPDGSGTKYEDMDSVKNLTSTDGETVTLYARWGATPYTVIFDKNSNEATGTMENISKAYNETFNLPENTYERTGYGFAGWNTSPIGDGTHYDNKQSVKNLDIDGEVTLYAEWTPVLVTITFDINTDDPNASGTMAGQIIVYDVQNTINENTYTRTGYAFDSWNTEPDGSGTKYNDKEDITNVFVDNTTLYAQWAVTPYTVIFNKNGGTGSMDNQEIAYGQQVALSKNTYTREHYKFLGWNTQEDGQGTHFDDEELVKNLDIDGEVNLYAEWKEYSSTLDNGVNINTIIKSINSNVVEIKEFNGIPDFDEITNEQIISLDTSNYPTYMWNDNDTIYYWSEAEEIYMNSSSSSMFEGLSNLKSVYLSELNTSKVISMGSLFLNDINLENVEITGWDTSNVEIMNNMFQRCIKLETLDFSNLDTSKVSNFRNMFKETSFVSFDLNDLDISSGTYFNGMLSGMDKLTTLEATGVDLSNVSQFNILFDSGAYTMYLGETKNIININLDGAILPANMSNAFSKFTDIESISMKNADTSSVTNMSNMFSDCSKLVSIDTTGWNTSNVRDMSGMFNGAKSLDNTDFINIIDDLNTSNVTNMNRMFQSCRGVTALDLSSFDTKKVTNMGYMFAGNINLENLNVSSFNTSIVTNMERMFWDCSSLTSLDVTGFDTINVTTMSYMFTRLSVPSLDLSSFNTSSVTNMSGMFKQMTTTTVYTSSNFVTDSVTNSNEILLDTSLIGGHNTHYNSSMASDKTYARIDDPDNGKPGLFTDIADKPIEP